MDAFVTGGGTLEPVILTAMGDRPANRMLAGLPKAELVTVPGIGHAPILEEPEAAAGIDRLLGKVLAEEALSRSSAA